MSPIDVCRKYIESKNCFYLAKEDLVVYYSSDTGRKQDATWHKMTLAQTYRIISSIHFKRFDSGFLLQAFQEEDRVYERGVSSAYPVVEGIFNYYEHCDEGMLGNVLYAVISELVKHNYRGVILRELHMLCADVISGIGISDLNYTDELNKALEKHGFELRVDSRRPRIGGHLIACALHVSCKPKDVSCIGSMDFDLIVDKVVKEFK